LERYKGYRETGRDERNIFVSDKREHYRNVFENIFCRTCKFSPLEKYNENMRQRL